jgi:molybdopterin-guanine dinucleotide biosynthesis protein A/glyoxylase-like metal-dependent hydrolase (beta-lactamase superfamily II)
VSDRAAAIVLAGGASRRFGRDKLRAPYRGATVLAHTLQRVRAVLDEIWVVLAPDDPGADLPPAVHRVRDVEAGRGPLAGLAAGLGAVRADVVLVVGGDMPRVEPAVLRLLLDRLADDAEATALDTSEGPRPLPIALRREPGLRALAGLQASGRWRLRDLLEVVATRAVAEATWVGLDPERASLHDVDVPSDLDPDPLHAGAVRAGGVEVIALCDGWAPLPLAEECPGRRVDWDAERERFRWAFAGPASWAWHVHAFLVRTPAGEVLVDCGIGHLGRAPYDVVGRIETSLERVGTPAAAIRHVVHTHLHADHVGGAVRSDGLPRFPNARHHLHAAERAFFASGEEDGGAAEALARAGMLAVTADDVEIVAGLSVHHAPGHTPGHRVVVVEAGREGLVLAGDLLHLPIQVAHPEWPSSHDVDPALGAASRRRVLDLARARGWRVGVSHFAAPFGRVGERGWEPIDDASGGPDPVAME